MNFIESISDIKVYKTDGNSNIKANVSLTICGEFVVGGLRLIEGSNGLFVAMPSYKTKDGSYKDTSFPLTKEAREGLQNKVIEAYNQA